MLLQADAIIKSNTYWFFKDVNMMLLQMAKWQPGWFCVRRRPLGRISAAEKPPEALPEPEITIVQALPEYNCVRLMVIKVNLEDMVL